MGVISFFAHGFVPMWPKFTGCEKGMVAKMNMNSNRYDKNYEEIISTDEIKQIIEQYNIGKKPLAKLLGWGETTILRYLEGDIPTTEYSYKLKSILHEPEYYYSLLINRKEALTRVAYRKSKKAVFALILATKINVVGYYIVNKADSNICPRYAQFILYYIQAFSLGFYGREMFEEETQINANHTPYLKIYNDMRESGIHTVDIPDEALLAKDRALIDAVYESFTWYGPKALQMLVNSEKVMMKISRDKDGNKIISKSTLEAYFNEIINKYNISQINEISNYPDKKIPELK